MVFVGEDDVLSAEGFLAKLPIHLGRRTKVSGEGIYF
jgi:hypothetical protein